MYVQVCWLPAFQSTFYIRIQGDENLLLKTGKSTVSLLMIENLRKTWSQIRSGTTVNADDKSKKHNYDFELMVMIKVNNIIMIVVCFI